MKSLIYAALSASLALSVLGCERTLNMDKLKESIKAGGEDSEWPVDIESIDCPEKVKLEEGNEFECEVEFENGAKLDVEVEQTDNSGSIKWKTKRKFLTQEGLEETLTKGLAEKGVPVKTVDCDAKLATAGMKVDCDVKTATGQTVTFEVKVTKKGGIEWEPKGPEKKKTPKKK